MKGESISKLPIEDAKWDKKSRLKQWEEWRKKHPWITPPPSIAGLREGQGKTQNKSLPPSNVSPGQWACKVIGNCQPCPEDSLHFPYCQPYANRLPVSCAPLSSSTNSASPQSTEYIKGWQQCGKSVSQERWDYFEFTVFTAFIAVIGLIVFIRRQKILSERHYSVLNQRINS
ncbi:hypothetical protein K437DRAFT_154309 [Tilletiaria anomala UBC 951]|uniref:Uncharacterized protein n=1 Tax=Tilletiaria anomala (strain ATCC 24038 / CBS 436.72 / UBC 951) TaxID=1037660 RepID=A0A066VSE6_TILAU|nr:uncharacterized protein K437DRAFT_154309 [Tilletiaria anomala UBC 951]KDN43208.1 hypothetical protein K437DRAFT_154309 [Tilletiaria anomala UBC 951]